jgi:hypothetical protein
VQTASTFAQKLDTVSKVVDVGSKVIGAFGGTPQQPQGTAPVMMGVPVPVDYSGGGVPAYIAQPGVMYPTATGGMFPTDFASMGPGMAVPMGGGGGGGPMGPPGSEFPQMVDSTGAPIDPAIGEPMSPSVKTVLAVAGGAVFYYIFLSK